MSFRLKLRSVWWEGWRKIICRHNAVKLQTTKERGPVEKLPENWMKREGIGSLLNGDGGGLGLFGGI